MKPLPERRSNPTARLAPGSNEHGELPQLRVAEQAGQRRIRLCRPGEPADRRGAGRGRALDVRQTKAARRLAVPSGDSGRPSHWFEEGRRGVRRRCDARCRRITLPDAERTVSVQLGYALSAEEHAPLALVENARRAEEAGFSFALISDHFHPWIDEQGHSPFVWSVLGGIAVATEELRIGTGVTCPLIRIHPAVVAQAAATAATMLPGRFFFGVGTGENLNEHVLGDRWPPTFVRRGMLREAIAVMRELWCGELTSHSGAYYTVENARLYTLPDEPIEVVVAAGGPEAAELAGELGDGLCATAPDRELVQAFEQAGGKDKERFAQVTVCWGEDEQKAVETALRIWPNAGLRGTLAQELPLPSHFEQAAEMVDQESIAKVITCGPDPERHLQAIQEYVDAGFDRVYVHQVGADQVGFMRFYEREILPTFR